MEDKTESKKVAVVEGTNSGSDGSTKDLCLGSTGEAVSISGDNIVGTGGGSQPSDAGMRPKMAYDGKEGHTTEQITHPLK